MKFERSPLYYCWVAAWLVAAVAVAQPQRQVALQAGSGALGGGRTQPRERRQAASNSAKSNKKTKAFELECLAAHNKWRRLHQAGDLVFDKKITLFAQKRADFIAASDGAEFRHPNDLPYGENLAWHSRPTTSCADLIKMWYDEVELYNFRRGQFDHETGHFTQLVWRNTERVGCARALSSGPKGGIYLVCNYDPPGNFLGEALENVLQARRVAPLAPSNSQPAVGTALSGTPAPQAPTSAAPVPPTSSTTTTTTSTTTTTTLRPAERGASSKPAGDEEKLKKDKKKNRKGKGKKKRSKKNKKNKKKKRPTTTTAGPSLNLLAATTAAASG